MAKGVVIKNLWKIFPPRVAALRDINVEIAPGEFYVILGPSGSGKTTLLRILAGLEIPTKGSVIIGDKEVVNTEKGVFVEPQDRNIGMVFQNWALYPHMTVYENIAFPLELKGVPRRERDERVRDVAEALGIADLLDRKPSQISGGQQQRVALARALVKQPDVLLLDEPFSNLDARIRVAAREFVREIQKKLGITTVLVTHDQADAFSVGDRVMVLKDGSIQQIGSPEDLLDKPENMFIANFIGDPPMNMCELPINHYIVKMLDLNIDDLNRILIGIRPDDALAVETGEGHITGKVTMIEYVGSRRYAKVDLGDCIALRVLAESNITQGHNVKIKIRKLHVFSPDGKRLKTVTL